jgi:hypothetical protein
MSVFWAFKNFCRALSQKFLKRPYLPPISIIPKNMTRMDHLFIGVAVIVPRMPLDDGHIYVGSSGISVIGYPHRNSQTLYVHRFDLFAPATQPVFAYGVKCAVFHIVHDICQLQTHSL